MKRLIISFLLFFSFSIPLFSQDKEMTGNFDLYYNDEKIGEIAVKDFKELVKASEVLYQIRDAEENDRVAIYLKDDPLTVVVGKTFRTQMIIRWFNEKDEFIKSMILDYEVLIKKEAMSDFRILYRDISEVGFPVSVGINIFLGILLVLACL